MTATPSTSTPRTAGRVRSAARRPSSTGEPGMRSTPRVPRSSPRRSAGVWSADTERAPRGLAGRRRAGGAEVTEGEDGDVVAGLAGRQGRHRLQVAGQLLRRGGGAAGAQDVLEIRRRRGARVADPVGEDDEAVAAAEAHLTCV